MLYATGYLLAVAALILTMTMSDLWFVDYSATVAIVLYLIGLALIGYGVQLNILKKNRT